MIDDRADKIYEALKKKILPEYGNIEISFNSGKIVSIYVTERIKVK